MNKKQVHLLELLERSGPRLHAMLTRLTLDESVAEELMQDLFLKLLEIKKPEKIENLQAYAYRIAINLAFDRRRRKRDFLALSDTHIDQRTQKAEVKLIQNEQLQHILNAVEQLSGQTRECFVLHYIEQMDYDEIANRTQKTPKQVRGLCSKGIQHIRQILNEKNASSYREAINE